MWKFMKTRLKKTKKSKEIETRTFTIVSGLYCVEWLFNKERYKIEREMRNNEIKIEKYMNRVKVRIIIRVCYGKKINMKIQ